MPEKQKPPYVYFPEGEQAKPTLIFPAQVSRSITINEKPLEEEEIEHINEALNTVISGYSIDTLNQVNNQRSPEQIILDRFKMFVYSYTLSVPLLSKLRYVAGCDVGFTNAMVAAEAIDLVSGLKIVLAEAMDIGKAPRRDLIHTPEFRPYTEKLEFGLSKIIIKKAKIPIVSPIDGEIVEDRKRIRQLVLDQAVNPYDEGIIKESLRKQGVHKPMWIGTKVVTAAKDNPRMTATVAASLAGAGILAYFLKQRRSKSDH